ncbi:MAG: CDP-glycerol glycerophosphotransferase family protein [Gammaproteobacteria bacterium]
MDNFLKRKKIVYYIDNIQSLPISKPLVDESSGVIIVRSRRIYDLVKKQAPHTPIYIYSKWLGRFSRANKELSCAHAIIINRSGSIKIVKRFHRPIVMLFHGTFRDIGTRNIDSLAGTSLVLVNGPRQAKSFERFRDRLPLRCEQIGYIPFDKFITKTPQTSEEIKRKLGLNPQQKTVVYLPARKKVGSWSEHALKIANDIGDNINLIMRPHPNQLTEKTLVKELQSLFKKRKNHLLDIGDYHYNELLCIADVLISDATSPAEESLYYDTPQIFTESFTREEWRQTYEEDGLHPEDIKKLLMIYDTGISYLKNHYKDWGVCVKDALEKKNNFYKQRQNYFDYAFGDIKKGIAKRAVEIIYSSI